MSNVMGRLERDCLGYLARNPKGVKKNAEIAKATGSLNSSVSRSLRSLEDKGLVVRKFGKWTLSDEGKQAMRGRRGASRSSTSAPGNNSRIGPSGAGSIKTSSINPPVMNYPPNGSDAPALSLNPNEAFANEDQGRVPVTYSQGDKVRLAAWARANFGEFLPRDAEATGTVHAVETDSEGPDAEDMIWVDFGGPRLEAWRVADLVEAGSDES